MLYRKVVLPALLEMPKPSQCAKQEPDSLFHSWFCPRQPPAAETFQRVRRYNLSPLLDFVGPAYIQALPFDVCKPEKLNVEEEVPISEYPNRCIFQTPDPIWMTSRSPQLLPLVWSKHTPLLSGLPSILSSQDCRFPHVSSCCICKEQLSIYILMYFMSQVLALPQNFHDPLSIPHSHYANGPHLGWSLLCHHNHHVCWDRAGRRKYLFQLMVSVHPGSKCVELRARGCSHSQELEARHQWPSNVHP